LRDVFIEVSPEETRDIVVTIPKARLTQVETEEAEMELIPQLGRANYSYFWEMGRLPKRCPGKIYFAWNGSVRAYHDVTQMIHDGSSRGGKIYMTLDIHPVEPVIPMESFRGFRYWKG
jgi:hypothetical protein